MRHPILAITTIFACLGLSGTSDMTGETLSLTTEHAAGGCCAMTEPNAPTAPSVQTSTAPASHASIPAGVKVRGRVSIASGLSLQKPDLSRAVVYFASHPSLDAAPSGVDHATVAQRNKSFVPNFTVVSRGTRVEFPNWDDFDHNVFSRSKAAPAFDLDRYPKGQSKSRIFEKVGVVQLFCNIHPQMRAVVYVTPNRYFARCDEQGRFEIADAPPGDYQVVAWHERCTEQQQAISIGTSDLSDLALSLKEDRTAAMESAPCRDNGYGIERGLGVKRERLDLPVVKESHPAPDAPSSN